MKNYFLKLAILSTLFAGLQVTCGLAASSDWFQTDGARIRLIAMPAMDGKTVEAGIQFELEKGWKTYWRAPGASGLPPQIHFLGSKNIRSTRMSLPVPKAFDDLTGKSIGYKNHVIFPISITPKSIGQDVILNATGVVGVCSEICIPVQFQLAVTQKSRAGTPFEIAKLLNSAKEKLPIAAHEKMRINRLTRNQAQPRLLQLTTRIPPNSTEVSLFVEGPSSWYLSNAVLVKQSDQHATFTVDLQDAPKQANIEDTILRFTLVADQKGVEQSVKIGPVN